MDFEITIDGRTTGVNKGETILQAALRAGIDIPVFGTISFRDIRWDLFATPLWVDIAVSPAVARFISNLS